MLFLSGDFMRKVLLFVIAATAVIAFVMVLLHQGRLGKPLCKKCNVILISIDTLGAKHTSVYNPSLDTTVFLKKIADEQGIVFDHAYSQAPWTLPSHTAMLTGLYPWDAHIYEKNDKLPQSVYTIAEELNDHGYQTAAFSDGAFAQPDWGFNQGFQEFKGSLKEKDWNDLPRMFNDASAWLEKRKDDTKPFFCYSAHLKFTTPTGIGERRVP